MLRLYIKNNITGTVHEYGTDPHDALLLMEDGSLHYVNTQNYAGTQFPEEGYSFCREDGTAPNPNLEPDEEYIDIGGTQAFTPADLAHWIPTGTFDDFAKCSACGNQDHTLYTVLGAFGENRYNFCPNCGAKMTYKYD